jgi:GAF domain-containing protein
LLIFALVLGVLTVGIEIFRQRTYLVPSRLPEIARELYKTLDLQQLMVAILENAIAITLAQHGLIIVINPRTKRYVGHALYNFNLRPNRSIENLAKKCFVLVHGEPFESPDLGAAFATNTVYHEFFDVQPSSIMAEPLFNRSGQVMGVINVAHDNANNFDKISRSLLKEFAFLVSNAIERCFEHREVILREAKSREAGEKFVSAGSEDDVVTILIEEVRQQIPHAEKLTVHKYLPENDGLLPIHSYSLEATPSLYLWTGRRPRKLKPDLWLGYGIAGHALELKDTILVPDVDHHPWFVPLDHALDVKSLLVAPLFDPQDNELYGTISIEGSKPSAFNLDDESTLTYLSTQASRAIAKFRDFHAWREQGGILRKILEQIRSFDIGGTERILSTQIADAAASLLGFKIARIRLLSKDDMLVTVAVAGVPGQTRERLLSMDLPYSQLKPFLNETVKAESSYLIKRGTPGWQEFVDQYFHKPHSSKHKKSGWDIYDALITPLLDSHGKVIGILTLDMPVSGSEPNQQTLELIGVFANAVSWVIELSRFQRFLADRRDRAKSFIDTIGHELVKGRDLTTISEVVVQAGAKLLSAEGCSLYLVRNNEVVLTHSNFLAGTDYIARHKPISSQPRCGLTAWVASQGEMVCLNNGEHRKHPAWAGEEEHLEYLPSKACRSLLITPVKDNEGKVIAVITLENKKSLAGLKDFDEEDQERLQSLADEFAKALEVIGLLEDIREWERFGLADDLHDLINWYHSGVVMWIEAADEWLKRGETAKAYELMPQLRQHAHTTVQELKMLHTNFLAKSFEATTFRQALETTLSAWTERVTPRYEKNKMKICFDCPERLELPVRVRNTLIRIASLAFSNALQHSGIITEPNVEITVRVQQHEDVITLTVVDTGEGFDHQKNPPGFGLDRMRQLSRKMNQWGEVFSDLCVDTKINQGTTVTLSLRPVAPKNVG